MFSHILVPVDFSEKNRHALEVAVQVAALAGGTITLLHVIETIADATYEEFETFYQQLEERSREKIEALIKPYQEGPINIEHLIAYGNRAQEILSYAKAFGSDLIIMSSHRIDERNQTTGWGTISHKVGILAQCPIMLVK